MDVVALALVHRYEVRGTGCTATHTASTLDYGLAPQAHAGAHEWRNRPIRASHAAPPPPAPALLCGGERGGEGRGGEETWLCAGYTEHYARMAECGGGVVPVVSSFSPRRPADAFIVRVVIKIVRALRPTGVLERKENTQGKETRHIIRTNEATKQNCT